MLSKRTRDQLEKLPPDQRAKADAALARIDTPEYRAAEEAARRQYADHPSPGPSSSAARSTPSGS